jgi:hypothetical protein
VKGTCYLDDMMRMRDQQNWEAGFK